MKKKPITKKQAVNLFGGTQAALARALGLERAAISKWNDDAIPDYWDMKIRYELRPEFFGNQQQQSA